MLGLLDEQPIEAKEAERLLRRQARRIISRLPEEHFTHEGPFVYTAHRFPKVTSRPRALSPGTDPLSGKIIGMRGGYLLLEADQQLLTVSLRGLMGRELSARDAPVAGPVQGALAI